MTYITYNKLNTLEVLKKEPKVIIILTEVNGQKRRLSTSLTKIKNFGNLSLVKRAKLGRFNGLYIKFFYGRDKMGEVTNEMVCLSYSDLVWAFKAFSDTLLWL